MNLVKEKWTKKDYKEYVDFLVNEADLKYEKFNNNLITSKYKMIGIRIPRAKEIVKEIATGDVYGFLKLVENTYYEELLIEGLILAKIDNKELMENYISKIDNWGLCDYYCMNAKYIKKKEEYFPYFLNYLKSDKEFIIRTGLIMILCYFVKEDNIKIIFNALDKITCDKYYVNMGIAWLLCECFIKHRDITLPYLENNTSLNDWTFNKTISKIRESYRIEKCDKEYLNTLKRRKVK